MSSLQGKTYLLTGATGSIGRAIATKLASEGARMLLHYGRNHDAAHDLAHEIGNDAVPIAADLGKSDAPTKLWNKAAESAGRIDGLINNAGILSSVSIEAPLEDWHAVWTRDVQINLQAPADLCRAALNHFSAEGGGKIVNIASRAAQGGYRDDAMSYGATKAALVNLTQSIARGFGPNGVTAMAIAPGWVKTDMSDAYVREHGEAKALSGIPIGRMAETSEIADLVSFVLQPSQMSLSGAVLDVNGASQMR